MEDAGILDNKGKLTQSARKKIIERLKSKATQNGSAVSLDSKLDPSKVLLPNDIDDIKKYPQFDENIFIVYEKIAQGFNLQSNPSLPFPFCDPSALSSTVNLPDPGVDVAALPSLTPVTLTSLFGLPPESVPLLQAGFNTGNLPIPAISPPQVDTKINEPPPSKNSQKFEFDSWPTKLTAIYSKISTEVKAKPDVPALVRFINGQTSDVKNEVVNSQPFGPGQDGDEALKRVREDLYEFSTHCISIAVVGSNLGSSPKGVVGLMGFSQGYKDKNETTAPNKLDTPSNEPAKEIPPKKSNVTYAQLTKALVKAWYAQESAVPEYASIRIVCGQCHGENGSENGKFSKLWNYNIGNVKFNPKNKNDSKNKGKLYHKLVNVREIIGGETVELKYAYFRAFKSIEEGARYQLIFLKSNYSKAWNELKQGNPQAYAAALKKDKYYTEDLLVYTTGLTTGAKLCDQFGGKSAYDEAVKEIAQSTQQPQQPQQAPTEPTPPAELAPSPGVDIINGIDVKTGQPASISDI